MLLDTKQGEQKVASGGSAIGLRVGPYGQILVDDSGLGRYFEATRLGRTYAAWVTGFTLVAANATALAATTQFIVGFANPLQSGKAAVILRTWVQTRSGTPAGPFYFSAGVTSAAISTSPAGTITNLSTLATSTQAGTMRAYNNVALTGFVNASGGTPLALPAGGPAAIAAGAGVYSEERETAGSIIIPPGGVAGLLCTGAGTTHIVDASVTFAEIDWPL
jgi:hypothetical protein